MLVGLPDPAFWKGKRVLLTGHTGFKGSWLLYWLEAMGAQVSGLALPPEGPVSLFDGLHSMGRLAGEVADIRDAHAVLSLVETARPEIVFHLAAQSLVLRGYADPVGTFAVNVAGTRNVLEAVSRVGTARAIVVTTTDKVYRNGDGGRAFVESDPLGGSDPYSESKAACELVVAGYRVSHFEAAGCGIATARAGNVIGGGDWAENRLLPDAVRAWSRKASLEVRRPGATRPWQHVLEPLRGYLVLAERLHAGGPLAGAYNFGPDCESASVRHVLALAASHFDDARMDLAPQPEGPHEAHALALDPGLARRDLGITSLWALDQTVAMTARWYRQSLAGVDSRSLCAEDHATYLDSALRAASGERRAAAGGRR
ncbi:CDP-glucose 4,6-dehydratase [Hoeflea marina]|uniref:CDP-glucose 4,6-dehydratase n=1 Tax=Hoeflea marina TaxID=274592 RepID=A0A317PHQ0_9HYPH|nr:CDP-glucose 4,6-dehydratase [Hoeflea marina]PWV99962.1 CDP-glucose 4,6-dehydratase [Hoeflea marina]